MLKRDKRYFSIACIFVFFCFVGCNIENDKQIKDKSKNIYDSSVSVLGIENYNKLRLLIQDSINSWAINELGNWSINDSVYTYQLDSLLCINTSKTKLIGVILTQYKIPDNLCGGLLFFYGAKINSQWYFWSGESMLIPQEMNINIKYNKPISFYQLHEQAMKNFLGGYLTKNGEINEAWFESKFKDGRFPYEMRYKYKWILDGKKIDNEEDYWNYSYKKSGLKLWADKAYQDSITRVNGK